MFINIKAERQIKEINEEFTGMFPFLKLEFYRKAELQQDRYTMDKLLPQEKKMKDVWISNKEEAVLEVPGTMTVFQLENILLKRFGLAAQVFRKSGRVWLQTIRTDSWTLDHQNEHGREITESAIVNQVDDYDLNPGN
ncbi:MAG: hypothetical protein H7X84_02290 [Verrucomicrobia bacterium]|nr:hypothetical protein [Prolixibacteraceae bacterium]